VSGYTDRQTERERERGDIDIRCRRAIDIII